MTQEFSKPAATLLRAREQFAAEPTFTIARTNGSLEAWKKLEKWKRVKSRWTQTGHNRLRGSGSWRIIR